MPFRHCRETIVFRQRETRRPPLRPLRSTSHDRSLPRTAVDVRAGRPTAGRVNASLVVTHDPPVGAYFSPSQLLDLEMLRGPLEPKHGSVVGVVALAPYAESRLWRARAARPRKRWRVRGAAGEVHHPGARLRLSLILGPNRLIRIAVGIIIIAGLATLLVHLLALLHRLLVSFLALLHAFLHIRIRRLVIIRARVEARLLGLLSSGQTVEEVRLALVQA